MKRPFRQANAGAGHDFITFSDQDDFLVGIKSRQQALALAPRSIRQAGAIGQLAYLNGVVEIIRFLGNKLASIQRKVLLPCGLLLLTDWVVYFPAQIVCEIFQHIELAHEFSLHDPSECLDSRIISLQVVI